VFEGKMTKIKKRQANKFYEIYLSLYQAVTGNEEEQKIYKQFSPDFFALIVIDECHRGRAARLRISGLSPSIQRHSIDY
jgi:type I restriction enzyme, R subunit